MIKNYARVALRSFARHKFFSFINVFGLAISMSVCLCIVMLVADQLMSDRYNTKRDRIYRVTTAKTDRRGAETENPFATSPLPLGETLQHEYTGIEKTVRLRRGFGNGWMKLEQQDINIPVSGFFADAGALSLFEYELEQGDPETALKAPYSVVLTKEVARKLFKKDNPIGEVLKVGTLGEYTVTGVLKDNGNKTHIAFDALASWSTLKSLNEKGDFKSDDADWSSCYSGWTYLLVENGHDRTEVEKHLADIATRHKPGAASSGEERLYKFGLQNISDITPGKMINNPIGPFMPMVFVYFFGGLALIVMLTSCFNYTSLSIARALTRAKEIGVRKVNGAHRYQIFMQFLSESVMVSLFSMGIAVLLFMLIKPHLLNFKFIQLMRWNLEGNIYVYGFFLGFTVVTGLLAGFFPAVILSKFQPVKVLKSAGTMKLFSRLGLRKSLLVIQFSLSLIFIISVTLLYNQLNLFVKADHGFSMANKINVRLNNTSYQTLRNELSQYPNLTNIAAASHLPAAGMTYGEDFKRNLSEADIINMNYFYTDEHYIANMDITLIAGRNFNAAQEKVNKNNIIINEQAIKKFHFKSPHDAIGEVLYSPRDSIKFQIIGVIKDYNHQVLMTNIDPMALRFDSAQFRILQVGYTGNHEAAVKNIETAWAKVNPTLKPDYQDFEEEIRSFYKTIFSDLVNVIGVIAFMAIAIACLGLLGMATYAIEIRQKEISIRKVLGSRTGSLVMLLSKGFVILLLMATTIAVPAAWFINNLWLEQIAYRTPLDLYVIGSGIGIVFLLGFVTIGSQTLRAALANPVDALRNE